MMKDNQDENEKAFVKQIERQVGWIKQSPEARQAWLREQELFYRATDYRGS
jgi:hypothetical protein